MSDVSSTNDRRWITMRGVRTHNLAGIDVDIPIGALTVVTGVSGCGKSSLAFDTLAAEGQRRYIETFSAYSRQFLPQYDKPPVDSIENVPPAIAIAQHAGRGHRRSTVASAAGIADYLRLAFARASATVCPTCDSIVEPVTPEALFDRQRQIHEGSTLTIGFPLQRTDETSWEEVWARLREAGFVRVMIGEELIRTDAEVPTAPDDNQVIRVILDRLRVDEQSQSRFIESVETAFDEGDGEVHLGGPDGWSRAFDHRQCPKCGQSFPDPDPTLFLPSNPEAACPVCHGAGDLPFNDPGKVIPDRGRSLSEHAVAPMSTPGYRDEHQVFLSEAKRAGIPIDVPVRDFSERDWQRLLHGDADAGFDGIDGFFHRLEKKRYKPGVRILINRYRSYRLCPECRGARLRPEVLAHRIDGMNIADFQRQTVENATMFLRSVIERQQSGDSSAQLALQQLRHRVSYLNDVGLGYLSLDRIVRTLSTGEARRVAMTTALGTGLAKTLFVLDEPTAGLHPVDTARLITAIRELRDANNTVVVVEHDTDVIGQADWILELGPAAGSQGGALIYQGDVAGMDANEEPAGKSRRRLLRPKNEPRTGRGKLTLRGARTHNLKGIDVTFPLGTLCAVIGVSGSGKSSLVADTLFPAVANRLNETAIHDALFDAIDGAGNLDEVVLVDEDAVGRTSRGNAATYLKFFDQIRSLFAATSEAKIRGLSAGDFSFNRPGGRCETCEGTGTLRVDMQFLPEAHITCPECEGNRYQPRILEVKLRGRTIVEVLALTVQEAFSFFRGELAIQHRLKVLKDVGLDYLPLGQPLTTLSGGEAQRLKLSAYLTTRSSKRALFVLEEPTTGLHPSDVVKLFDCLNSLVDVGHSVIVVEHNLQLMMAADHLIELGPGAGDAGGQVIAQGTATELMRAETPTSRELRRVAGDSAD